MFKLNAERMCKSSKICSGHLICTWCAHFLHYMEQFEHVELSTYLRVREDGKYLKIIDTNRHQ
jgi:hypothetical protein